MLVMRVVQTGGGKGGVVSLGSGGLVGCDEGYLSLSRPLGWGQGWFARPWWV